MSKPKGINEVNSNDWEQSDSVGEVVEEVAQDVGVGAREATAVFKDGKVRLTATPHLHGNGMRAALVVRDRNVR